jgi:hypothetical protein
MPHAGRKAINVKQREALCMNTSPVPLFLFLGVVSIVANAQDAKRSFPDSLFGVKLGSVHQLAQSGKQSDVGTLPIKEFKGMNQFIGNGVHFYFRPSKDYLAFKYIEKPKKPNDEYFATSFRLYLLPVIPKDASSPKELESPLLKWEVTLVEWSEDNETDKDKAYFWAIDFCKSLQVDLGRKADIADYFDSKWYSCKFQEKDRELGVDSLGGTKSFTLKYSRLVFERKDKAVDTVLRKLQMNTIRPY